MMYATVKPLRNCPSPQQWSEHLERDDVPAQWLVHLESCPHCQGQVEQWAAAPPLWKEASETLSMRVEAVAHLAETILPLSIEDSQLVTQDPMCQHELAQLQQLLAQDSDSSPKTSSGSLRSVSSVEPIARIGRYELEQLVGRGGMGLVFRAWDSQLHRVVAVKTLGMSLWALPSARQRFVREGRAAAMLNHPHIVPLYDVITEPPIPALVMQYIAGPTLDQWIHSRGPMPWPDALRIAWQLADALSAAHREGLVHRDIKPGNVLLEADGSRALLSDFGLVRAIDDATLTQSGLLAGTPHFMSPEQARGEEVDGRSDLFSLGSLLYYAISGQPPFTGRESMAVLNALCHTRQIPLRQRCNQLPVEVSQLVDRLLNKSVAARPASADQVRDQLRRLIEAEPRLSRPRTHRSLMSGQRWLILSLLMLLAMLAWLPFLMRMSPANNRAIDARAAIRSSPSSGSVSPNTQSQPSDLVEKVATSDRPILLSRMPELDRIEVEIDQLRATLQQLPTAHPWRAENAEPSVDQRLSDIESMLNQLHDWLEQ